MAEGLFRVIHHSDVRVNTDPDEDLEVLEGQ
jgi:hypothetical protein